MYQFILSVDTPAAPLHSSRESSDRVSGFHDHARKLALGRLYLGSRRQPSFAEGLQLADCCLMPAAEVGSQLPVQIYNPIRSPCQGSRSRTASRFDRVTIDLAISHRKIASTASDQTQRESSFDSVPCRGQDRGGDVEPRGGRLSKAAPDFLSFCDQGRGFSCQGAAEEFSACPFP